MKRDTEIIRDFLLSLIRDPDSAGVAPSGTFNRDQAADLDADMTEAQLSNLLRESWDPLESELSVFPGLEPALRALDPNLNPVTQLGDLSAVQNRFQTLLKDRLRAEIERHPPLFPWEKSAQEYPDTVPGERSMDLWTSPLQGLAIPAVLPDDVLSTLLEGCQQVIHQSLKSGIQLVKAVEDLFPDQPQTLQNVAQIVLQPAYRSPAIAEASTLDYAQANTQQQIALSMLTAREILSALSLKVSRDRPQAQQEWQTVAGALGVSVSLEGDSNLSVQASLPVGGYLELASAPSRRTDCRDAGVLQLTLEAPELGQLHALAIGLGEESARPLRFVVGRVDNSETP
ncbi:hypothetical protein C7271_14685 [filamentous cyanobacterium CCP5]|nr:hypothetical protein C7271_14685 [filamentous cyanobacterium CCP5]